MDYEQQKKPRNIKMRHPAPYPYSQSWAENQSSEISKKKTKVHNANRGPAHSQSFAIANDRSAKRAKRNLPSPKSNNPLVYPLSFSKTGQHSERKITRPKKSWTHRRSASGKKPSTDPFSGGPWHPAKPKIRGPDPTAPHLKYGLFKPPKRNENKSQIQVMSPTGQDLNSRTSSPEHSSMKDKKLKPKKGQLPEGAPPIFVYRAIDPRSPRQLSVSGPTHLDIRPRAKPALLYAPTVEPGPNNKGSSESKIKSNLPVSGVMPAKKSAAEKENKTPGKIRRTP